VDGDRIAERRQRGSVHRPPGGIDGGSLRRQ